MTEQLSSQIEAITTKAGGQWGVAAETLQPAENLIQQRPDNVFYAASVNKIAIAACALARAEAGELDATQRLPLAEEVKRPGTGVLRLLEAGLKPTINDALTLMLVVSDNTAAKMLVNHLDAERINRQLQEWQFKTTQLEITPEGGFTFGYTTPRETARLLRGLFAHRYISEASVRRLLRTMGYNHFSFGFRRSMPDKANIASKEGVMPGMRHEAGLVLGGRRPYLLCAFSEKVPGTPSNVDSAGTTALSSINRTIYQYLRNRSKGL